MGLVKHDYDPGGIPPSVLQEAGARVAIGDYPDHLEILVSGNDGNHIFVQWYFMLILCNFHGYQASSTHRVALGYQLCQILPNMR